MFLRASDRQAEGDRYFLTGVDAAVRAHAEAGLAPVYKYVIEQKPSLAIPAIIAGSLGNRELHHLPWGKADDILVIHELGHFHFHSCTHS